ncbi:hypothetical protein A3709_00280 [Halioglobus sp. HI00S01]|uniref:hypothetical protein n=1 Tax=Halioglobus sp. HI00S01 TaxID=1822214 RepID=UPI0007C3FE42|nr:hypothetical protein [Halioglobus sp. HI00S01]KZX60547.1 hypothetical protein A3709_00280 [Halioglobus sp. HI00S01]
MAIVAIPKRPRPHQPEAQVPANDSRKRELIEMLARGDFHGAESIREEMCAAKEKVVSKHEATATPANNELSFVSWRNDEGELETLEMTATPEAQAYFESVMAKEAAN